jgi:hypothetical protein
MKIKIIVALLFCTSLLACSENQEDLVKEPNKNASIETEMNVTHEVGYDLLKTTHKVWYNGAVSKIIQTLDTIKSLGMEEKTVEDENGDEQTVTGPVDYEIFITVK